MTAATEIPIAQPHRVLAAAVAGDRQALQACIDSRTLAAAGLEHRLLGTLTLRADEHQLAVPEAWLSDLRLLAARSMHYQSTLRRAGGVLAAAGVEWVVLKGLDLAARVYDGPEERPSADIDILIAPHDYRRARAALESAGWASMFSEPAYDDWVERLGHAWAALHSTDRVALELHLRLWSMVPQRAARDLLEASTTDPELPPGGRRLPLPHAYVLAAVHALLDAPPRPLFQFRDLERIAASAGAGFVDTVVDLTTSWEIELPVLLAAACAQSLWHDDRSRRIAASLESRLRWPERRVWSHARHAGIDAIGPSLAIARLLSGRATRRGWSEVPRRFWAHPGVLAQETPHDWPKPLRRAFHVLMAVGLDGMAKRLAGERLGPTGDPD